MILGILVIIPRIHPLSPAAVLKLLLYSSFFFSVTVDVAITSFFSSIHVFTVVVVAAVVKLPVIVVDDHYHSLVNHII